MTTTRRMLGTFRGKGDPAGGIRGVRELSMSEATGIEDCAATLRSFLDRPVFTVQSEMYRAVRESIDALMFVTVGIGPNSAFRSDTAELANRMALWLQATRMFLDQTEAAIKRRFGHQSNEWRQWEQRKHQLHLSNAGYALLYEVRNVLHAEPVPLNYTSAADVGPPPTRTTLITLDMDRLRADERISKLLERRPDVASHGLRIEVLVEDMQESMESLKHLAMSLDLPEARRSAEVLASVLEEALRDEPDGYAWPILFSVDGPPLERLDELRFLPVHLLEHVPTDTPQSLTVVAGHQFETVGHQATRMRLSYRSWATGIEVHHSRTGQVGRGQGFLWASRLGPGWGGFAVVEEGRVDPGHVVITTDYGVQAAAILDTLTYRGSAEFSVAIGSLIGKGAAPPDRGIGHGLEQRASSDSSPP